MPQYYLWTIGCQMNQADSAYIAAYLESLGYLRTTTAESADLVVLNSCVVRQSAEDKVNHKLEQLKGLKKKHPHLTIALTGCLVDSQISHPKKSPDFSGNPFDKLKQKFPFVDLFFPPQDWETLSHWGGKIASPDLLPHPAVSTFVPIIKGCNNFCTYCIVPYRRGREKSRPAEEIVCQVERLVQQGTKEVVLLGQNVDSYGHDLPGKPDLADLLTELNKISSLWRIRFLTNHPKDMTHKLIKAIASLDKVCPDISLAVQSGDNQILKAMRRGYTIEEYHQLAAELRSALPDLSLNTDVVVGFPGETEEQFERTASLLSQLRFDLVHVAMYSPRPGTIAARKLIDNVPPEEKQRRWRRIEALQHDIATEINARLLGKTVEVLVTGKKSGKKSGSLKNHQIFQGEKWHGRTRTGKLVFFPDAGNCLGQLVRVKIEKTGPWSLQGRKEE